MSIEAAPDQKRIVLGKRKDTAFVGTGRDFQVYLHLRSVFDPEVVKCNFVDVAGVESGAATFEV